MLVFFLKDFVPGDRRLNKSESFHLKNVSFCLPSLQQKPLKSSEELLFQYVIILKKIAIITAYLKN